MTDREFERIDELLADQAIWGLSEEHQRELDALLDRQVDAGDEATPSNWETAGAMAAVAIATRKPVAPPAELMQRLERDALGYLAEHHGVGLDALRTGDRDPVPALRAVPAVPRSAAPLGFFLAAAAAIVAAVLWVTRPDVPALVAGDEFYTRLASADVRLPWSAGEAPVEGEVVWDSVTQSGVMRLRGVPVNDPVTSRYQLWIFDGKRDTAQPVDGGIFDVRAVDGEVFVVIDAKIPVHEAAAFAITREIPGGVVVSKREHIVATAGL